MKRLINFYLYTKLFYQNKVNTQKNSTHSLSTSLIYVNTDINDEIVKNITNPHFQNIQGEKMLSFDNTTSYRS